MALLLGFIGLVAYGGPAAHVALMRREVVERRGWLEAQQFSRMWAACNLIPGPSSTELAIFIGYRLAGWPGLLAAGACFIAPAMVIMLALAWAYTTYSNTHLLVAVLAGVRPVVIGIIAWAALDLARKTLERRRLLLVAVGALILYLFGFNPLLILVVMALVTLLLVYAKRRTVSTILMIGTSASGPHPERLVQLILTFLKLGAVSFGSGYVLFAFLQSDFVTGLHWLKPRQLVDAVAIGQVTPGPVFTTATFLAFLLVVWKPLASPAVVLGGALMGLATVAVR